MHSNIYEEVICFEIFEFSKNQKSYNKICSLHIKDNNIPKNIF